MRERGGERYLPAVAKDGSAGDDRSVARHQVVLGEVVEVSTQAAQPALVATRNAHLHVAVTVPHDLSNTSHSFVSLVRPPVHSARVRPSYTSSKHLVLLNH